MAGISAEDIAGRSVEERLDLIDRLWDSFEPDEFPHLSKAETDLLDRRLEQFRAHPERTRSREDIEADIRRGD
jgi:putative addiction module component (TIGR02574 family)